MKIRKMAARLYQFNNIEDKQGNCLYPLDSVRCGGFCYNNDFTKSYRYIGQGRAVDLITMLFGKNRKK